MFRKKISITLIDYKRVSQYLDAGILKQLATILCHDIIMECGILADIWRNNDLIITSKRRFWGNDDVIFYAMCPPGLPHSSVHMLPWQKRINIYYLFRQPSLIYEIQLVLSNKMLFTECFSFTIFRCCYRAILWEKAQNWNTHEKNIVEW